MHPLLAIAKLALVASLALSPHHAPARHYTVRSGDTLSAIAQTHCGKITDWTGIYRSNRRVIGASPNLIYPGQRLRLTCYDPPALLRLAARPASPPAAAPATAGMGPFEQCVIARESGGNPLAVNPVSGAGGLFQFLPSTWASLPQGAAYPGGAQTAPVSAQEAAFAVLYARAGPSPWAPYDGC